MRDEPFWFVIKEAGKLLLLIGLLFVFVMFLLAY
jgi:hypothetical protein